MAILTFTASLCFTASGCKSPAPKPSPTASASQYPARPNITPPYVKLFHKTDDSLTLVVDEDVTDTQLAALLWELHDAAKAHTFDSIGIPQAFVDKRDPIVWMHIYRGAKCASEKYTNGKYPCGASYHGAADYTFGGFTHKDRDDGVVISNGKETHLWDPNTQH
ncbi:hypothetical protein ACFQBQ_05305 [Granulicella cerasi]|uniref:Uncharacterized protein n=1 Tax=Granulicella cerasi TaxID=741063 RepID=A0ABW1Z7F6_9BACT|nr:hypothetical protein [Granulicella cerasi]